MHQPRKLLMTADAVGGVWTYALELCAGLAESDIEIVLATMGPEPTRAQREAVARYANVRLEPSDFRLEWMPNPWDDIDLASEWLLDLAEVHRPDLIHLNGYVHAALPWAAPVVVVAHSSVWSWWRAVHGADPPLEWQRYRKALVEGLTAADAIVAPSQAMLDSLQLYFAQERREAKAQPRTVIYNGRDLAPSDLAGNRSPLILAAGRIWDEAKNMRVLDAAARIVQWPVCVAGEPISPYGQETELLHARLLGPLAPHEMHQWYARAAIYALPALYEPFGLSALEAAIQGCALVLSDLPSLREVWGDAALFVPPLDAERWADTLNRLASDAYLTAEYARRAQLHASRYTRAAMVRRYQSLYAELLATRMPIGDARSALRQVPR